MNRSSRSWSVTAALLLVTACTAGTQVPNPSAHPVPTSETAAAPRPFTPAEYAARRSALLEGLEDGVLLVLGARETDADYMAFAQRPDFRYLTGVVEPGAALLVQKRGGRLEEQLFVLPRDPAREIWEGPRLGPAGATAATGMEAEPITALPRALEEALSETPRLYVTEEPVETPRLLATLSPVQQMIERLRAGRPELEVVTIEDRLAQLRAVKDANELDLIRRAVDITVLAQRAAIRAVEPGRNEFEIQALIEYVFRRYGAERPAFSSIVGSGPNATVLHYRSADRFMRPGEMVVMDVGASYAGYAADVTRTVPVSGTFTADQRAVYEIVLAAQKAAEERVKPGVTWQELNAAAEAVLAAGLARLGLIESPTATYRCESARFGEQCPQYRLYYMHGLGHGIGLDVHDPEISYFGPFREGSVFTIEPGLYIRRDALDHLADTPRNREMAARLRDAVGRYANIGVRIEDDYVVTATGVERLSEGAPREVAEIEELMREETELAAERRDEIVEWYRSLRGDRR